MTHLNLRLDKILDSPKSEYQQQEFITARNKILCQVILCSGPEWHIFCMTIPEMHIEWFGSLIWYVNSNINNSLLCLIYWLHLIVRNQQCRRTMPKLQWQPLKNYWIYWSAPYGYTVIYATRFALLFKRSLFLNACIPSVRRWCKVRTPSPANTAFAGLFSENIPIIR